MAERRPIRVLHIIDGLSGGGSERWIWELVRFADPRGIRHRVVPIHPDLGRFVYTERLQASGALGNSSLGRRDRESAGNSARAVFASHTIPPRLRAPLVTLWHAFVVFPSAFVRVVREYRRFNPNVIHAHTFHGFIAGVWLARWSGRPLVYTVPSFFGHIEAAGYGWAVRAYARHRRRVAFFITNYPKELSRLGIPADKILVVNAMTDVRQLIARSAKRDAYRDELRRRLEVSGQALVALTVGRMSPDKGYDYGLRAWAGVVRRYPDARWVIVGDGAQRAELVRQADALGVSATVHFAGFVEDPAPYYLGADLYIRPHVLEGDNLSSVQAMTAGLPVVGFDTGTEAELTQIAGSGLLVTNRDADALANRAIELLTDEGRRRSLGAAGASYASAHLDVRAVVERCETVYRTVESSLKGLQ